MARSTRAKRRINHVRGKKKRQARRKEQGQQKELKALQKLGLVESDIDIGTSTHNTSTTTTAAHANRPRTGPDSIRVVRLARRPLLAEDMKRNEYPHDHSIFKDFLRTGGKGSGTVYIFDKDTDEFVFAVRIAEHKDMKEEDRRDYAKVFEYFQTDTRHTGTVACNGAMIDGEMHAMGYRSATDDKANGHAYGTYSPRRPNTDWYEHSEKGKEIHRIFASRFESIAPSLYLQQVEQRRQTGVPSFGFNQNDNEPEYVYFSNLAYTRKGFANRGHCDNDLSKYTFGIGGNVWKKTGKMATFEDGYSQRGGFFYVADYGIIVDYAKIDGVCEQIWQVPRHVHSTVRGLYPPDFTRFGSSSQINSRLERTVREFMKNPQGRYVIDDWRRFAEAQGLTKEENERWIEWRAEMGVGDDDVRAAMRDWMHAGGDVRDGMRRSMDDQFEEDDTNDLRYDAESEHLALSDGEDSDEDDSKDDSDDDDDLNGDNSNGDGRGKRLFEEDCMAIGTDDDSEYDDEVMGDETDGETEYEDI